MQKSVANYFYNYYYLFVFVITLSIFIYLYYCIRIYSTDYNGYYLADCQILTGTLSFFHDYLILTNDNDDIKVLIPKGKVIRSTTDGIVKIDVTGNKKNEFIAYQYDLDKTFHILKAKSVESRLYLAAIYAANSTNHKEV